jgi:hypothetical protein
MCPIFRSREAEANFDGIAYAHDRRGAIGLARLLLHPG